MFNPLDFILVMMIWSSDLKSLIKWFFKQITCNSIKLKVFSFLFCILIDVCHIKSTTKPQQRAHINDFQISHKEHLIINCIKLVILAYFYDWREWFAHSILLLMQHNFYASTKRQNHVWKWIALKGRPTKTFFILLFYFILIA